MTTQTEITLNTHGLALPHLDQYFGVWAILEDHFRRGVEHARTLDVRAHLAAHGPQAMDGSSSRRAGYQMAAGGVAVIELSGPLMKHASSFSEGASTALARRAIRAAVRDEAVNSLLLRIDSPGGTVAGTKDLADDVAAAAAQKPVHAYIEDLGASAAYWIASQANKVYANETAIVGSIGTFMVMYDQSAAAEQLGVKVHVIRAGDFKGAGTPGTEVTPEQLAEWQRVVNELNEHFLKAVATGRQLSSADVKALADGRVHVGKAAAKLGLIDGVQSFDQTLSKLSSSRTSRSPRAMDGTTNPQATEPKPATLADLRAGCVGADNDFLIAQLEKNATLAVAQAAWMAEQSARLKAAEEQLAKAGDEAAAAKTKPGVKPLATVAGKRGPAASDEADTDVDASEDPVAAFNAAVLGKMRNGVSRTAAVLAAARANPALHCAYLQATNPGKKKQALIADRFADE